jgi:hypothetical protein
MYNKNNQKIKVELVSALVKLQAKTNAKDVYSIFVELCNFPVYWGNQTLIIANIYRSVIHILGKLAICSDFTTLDPNTAKIDSLERA